MKIGQQSQSETLFFKPLLDDLTKYSTEFGKIKPSQSDTSIKLKKQIEQKINALKNYLDKSQIYIVFMGTTSSGKSTLINSLLGQPLLPSKNQKCTSQVLYIGHQNINNDEGTAYITINKDQYVSIKNASDCLQQIQKQKDISKVNIKTQSYFHSTLYKDLQKRVYFIDTPGIDLSDGKQVDYFNHFAKINELIKLDECSIRINIWVLNYTTFDSEKKIQQSMKYMTQSQDQKKQLYEQNQIDDETISKYQKSEIYVNETIQQSNQNQRINPFFFIMNKYDLKGQSDNSKEQIKSGVKVTFDSENFFFISAQDAFNYNVMNYGLNEVKKLFISDYFEQNKIQLRFQKSKDAETFCSEKIKYNNELIQQQDYLKFVKDMLEYMQNQLNSFGKNLFNILNQEITLYKFMNVEKPQLTQLQKQVVNQFLSTFEQKKLDYKNELKVFKDDFITQITQLIDKAKRYISNSDPEEILQKTCKNSLNSFFKINNQIYDQSKSSCKLFISQLGDKLNNEQDQSYEKYFKSIIIGCESIFLPSMEDQFQEYQKQSFKKFADELFSKLGVSVKRSYWLYPILLIGSVIIFWDDIKYRDLQFNLPLLESSLDEWKLSLQEQIEDLICRQIQIYSQTLDGIRTLMREVVS